MERFLRILAWTPIVIILAALSSIPLFLLYHSVFVEGLWWVPLLLLFGVWLFWGMLYLDV